MLKTQSAPPSLAFLLALGAAGVLAGCTSPVSQDDSEPYAAEFEAAVDAATSNFERNVLEDGEITRSEFDEAVHNYLACLRNIGIDVTAERQGDYYIYGTTDNDGYEASHDACAVGTTAVIEPLYVSMMSNPENGDLYTLRARCLVKSGAAPEDYTRDEFKADLKGDTQVVDTQSEEFRTCMEDVTSFDYEELP